MRIKQSLYIMCLTVLCVVLVSCAPGTEESEEAQKINRILLPSQVFPIGWQRTPVGFDDVEGTVSMGVTFKSPSGPGGHYVPITQLVSVYPTADAARDAYPAVESSEFPVPDWFSPAQLSSYKNDIADEFQFRCLLITINEVPAHTCTALGRYGNIISKVWTLDKCPIWSFNKSIANLGDEHTRTHLPTPTVPRGTVSSD